MGLIRRAALRTLFCCSRCYSRRVKVVVVVVSILQIIGTDESLSARSAGMSQMKNQEDLRHGGGG